MRCGLKTLCITLFSASCAVSSVVGVQPGANPGFRVFKDQNDRVVAAEYFDVAAVRYRIRRGQATQDEFVPSSRLHEFPHLERVVFNYGTELTSDELKHLSKAKSLVEIEMGFVGASSESVTIEGDMRQLGQLKRLERIHLCKDKIADKDLAFVAELPQLKELEFNATAGAGGKGPRCTDRCADFICQASTLKYLWVHDAEGLTDQFVSKATSGLSNLEHFEMSSSRLTDESLRLLASRCRKLNWLDIGSSQFTDEGVRHLGALKNLEKLWLHSNALRNQSIHHLKNLKRLQHLEVTVPTVNDQDVMILASFRELEILALRRPALSDRQLQMFRGHPRLKSAFLNGSQLSEEALVQVIETLPNLAYLQIYGNPGLQRVVNLSLGRKRHQN